MNEDNGDTAREFEGREQTETLALLQITTSIALGGKRVIAFEGASFPSLPHWRFGLVGKKDVPDTLLAALAAQIDDLCDGVIAHFDYQPFGMELYEIDKWGLAILQDEEPPVDV